MGSSRRTLPARRLALGCSCDSAGAAARTSRPPPPHSGDRHRWAAPCYLPHSGRLAPCSCGPSSPARRSRHRRRATAPLLCSTLRSPATGPSPSSPRQQAANSWLRHWHCPAP